MLDLIIFLWHVIYPLRLVILFSLSFHSRKSHLQARDFLLTNLIFSLNIVNTFNILNPLQCSVLPFFGYLFYPTSISANVWVFSYANTWCNNTRCLSKIKINRSYWYCLLSIQDKYGILYFEIIVVFMYNKHAVQLG